MMRTRGLAGAVVALLVAAGCSSALTTEGAGPVTTSGRSISSSATLLPTVPPATVAPLPAEPTVELLGWESETPAMWWPVLRTFGLGAAPGVSPSAEALPDMDLPDGIERLDLGMAWGVDSTANLALFTGESAGRADLLVQLEAASEWVVAGDGWSAVAARSGLTASFEMDALMQVVGWMAEPATACDKEDACPGGARYGFPSPPLILVSNHDVAPADFPFGQELVAADGPPIDVLDGWGPTYVSGGQFVGTGLDDLGVEGGPGVSHFGVLLVVDADTGIIRSTRRWEPRAGAVTWIIPNGWLLDGLAVVRGGQDDGALVVTGTFAGERQARALELHLDGLNGQDTYRASTDMADSVVVSPPGSDWSLPKSFFFSDLHVVDHRSDGWYLVRVTNDGPVDLLRSDAPIVDYALDAAERHLALVIAGAAGVSNWWVFRDQVEELPGSATALAWKGSYPAPMFD